MNRWEFELLDRADTPIGMLDGVTGGSAEIVAQSQLGGSGSLSLDERGADIDWMSHRVRAWFHTGAEAWAVGTYLLTSPTETHSDLGVSYKIGLLTKMSIPSEDTVEARFSLGAGSPIIPAIVELIESTGETRIAATESTIALSSGLTWEAGTSKLTIINDLLQAAGYWSLWCDGTGQFRVEPYVNPADRGVSRTFEHGNDSVHYADWSYTRDMASVPNRFIAVGSGDEEAPPLVGVATNEDPNSPFSFQARGRWVTMTEEGVESETQAVIDQYAARRLREQMAPVSKLRVKHAMLNLAPNDLVAFVPEDGVRRLATIQRMSMSFTFDTDIDADWRLV